MNRQERRALHAQLAATLRDERAGLKAARDRIAYHAAKLAEGRSTDPAADRYFLREARGMAWVRQANVLDIEAILPSFRLPR